MLRKNMQMRTRDFDLRFKGVDDDGTFTGYGSVFGVEDAYKEVVAPGAFADSLKDIKAKGRPVPVLWQHSTRDPIGVYEELKEDKTGLYVKGRLLIEHLPLAKQAHALMQAGAVSGLSIGYLVRESSFDEKTGIRTLTKLELMEISIVTFPANEDARIDAVKAKIMRGETPTIREFEGILREKGFSRSDAEDIAALGFKAWLRRESGAEARPAETVQPMLDHLAEARRALQTPLSL